MRSTWKIWIRPVLVAFGVALAVLSPWKSHSSPAAARYSTLAVDSVRVYFVPLDRRNAERVVRYLTLDGLPISDELGLHRLPAVEIFIAPNPEAFDSLGGTSLPEWTAAMAMPHARRIVLKSPRWNRKSELIPDLLHELTHVMVHEAAGGHPVPRWLNEGLATWFSRDPQYARSRALGRAILTRSLIDLDQIDFVLRFRRAKAELAYKESLEAVRYLFERFGPGVAQDILAQIRAGLPFEIAFRRATGVPYRLFKLELVQYWRKRHRWDFLADLVYVLWGMAVVLVVAAYFYIRRRNRRRLREWEERESALVPAYWRFTNTSALPGRDEERSEGVQE